MTLPEGLKDFSLAGKAALIIGAEHAVGRVTALTLAEAGAKVVIASQARGTDGALNQLAQELRAAGQRDAPMHIQNAAIRSEVSATVDFARERLGRLDILVTALDTPFFAPIEATDDQAFKR